MSDFKWYYYQNSDDIISDDKSNCDIVRHKFVKINDLSFYREYNIFNYENFNFLLFKRMYLYIREKDTDPEYMILVLNDYIPLPPVSTLHRIKLKRIGNSLRFEKTSAKEQD